MINGFLAKASANANKGDNVILHGTVYNIVEMTEIPKDKKIVIVPQVAREQKVAIVANKDTEVIFAIQNSENGVITKEAQELENNLHSLGFRLKQERKIVLKESSGHRIKRMILEQASVMIELRIWSKTMLRNEVQIAVTIPNNVKVVIILWEGMLFSS